jgi:hypothetical protein
MALVSPGVEVTVIDESNYLPAATNSVPYILLATAQDKISGTGVTVTQTANTVNLSALTNVQADTNPQLGGNLNLNSRNITGTGNITITGAITVSNVNALVYGIDIRQLQDQVNSGGGGADVDFGSFDTPAPGGQDFGSFT